MKKINFCFVLIILSFMLLAGCTEEINDPNFTMPKNNHDGYVALSIYNDTGRQMVFSVFSPDVFFDVSIEDRDIFVETGDGSKNYILKHYPSGNYVITGLDPVRGFLTSDWGFVYKFKVYPGKITYIGSFYVDIISTKKSTKEKLGMVNAFAEDLPVFLHRYKNIPPDFDVFGSPKV